MRLLSHDLIDHTQLLTSPSPMGKSYLTLERKEKFDRSIFFTTFHSYTGELPFLYERATSQYRAIKFLSVLRSVWFSGMLKFLEDFLCAK